MLICATAEDIRKYGDSVYELALNPAKSCYPTYCDGIKTKTDFLNAAENARTGKTSELLLFALDGRVEGWISYFWIPEDKYLQIDGCNLKSGAERALAELLDALESKFAGYTAYFGYPGENHEAIRFLQQNGFECAERTWNHSFIFGEYRRRETSPNVEKISRTNFDRFRAAYHASPDAYWNCERIYESIDEWTIFVYNQGSAPVAAVFSTGSAGYFEIYGVEFTSETRQIHIISELLIALLNEYAQMGAKYLTYLCDEAEKDVLRELGFRCVGQYVLYTKVFS